jgi:glutamate-1-semialdehyde 2,1-aminomutase
VSERSFNGSHALFERARAVLAGGVSTAFRVAELPVPLYFAHAEGAHLVDVDGNDYVDYVCGYGPVILGHSDERVSASVTAAAARLQQIGGQHEGEIELAERLCALVPAFERVRFGMTGSEAIHAALRLARAATGRQTVVKFAGHSPGWFVGVYTGTSGRPPGTPESDGQDGAALENVTVLDWNDGTALEELFERAGQDIAAVVLEPLACNGGVIWPADGYLALARELTRRHGALLIFDEVITGFRIGLGGAQELLGVTPDLAVVAKALGNGFPISAFGGKAELMEAVATNAVVHAGTYNGGGISIAAALATTDVLASDPAIYSRMEGLGRRLMQGIEELGARHGRRIVADGPGPVFFVWFRDGAVTNFRDHLDSDFAGYAQFAERLLAHGVRTIPNGRWYLTGSHTDADVDATLDAADRALADLASEQGRPSAVANTGSE